MMCEVMWPIAGLRFGNPTTGTVKRLIKRVQRFEIFGQITSRS
jgi:hypothetical protein